MFKKLLIFSLFMGFASAHAEWVNTPYGAVNLVLMPSGNYQLELVFDEDPNYEDLGLDENFTGWDEVGSELEAPESEEDGAQP